VCFTEATCCDAEPSCVALQVMQDLLAWWPKVADDGIMAGHDFRDLLTGAGTNSWEVQPDGTTHPEWKAVRGAVLDFATMVGRQVSVTYEDPTYPSWAIRR
jgi:hypothetical protein